MYSLSPFKLLYQVVAVFLMTLPFLLPLGLMAFRAISWTVAVSCVLSLAFLFAILVVLVEPRRIEVQFVLVFGYGAIMVGFLGNWSIS